MVANKKIEPMFDTLELVLGGFPWVSAEETGREGSIILELPQICLYGRE